MDRRLKQSSFIYTVILVVVFCIVVSVSLPHNSYIRYQSFSGTIFSKLTWIYERIHYDDRAIDVVILGSSREGAAANSGQIEERLAALGHQQRVVNFSMPAAGFDVRLTKLRELLSRRKIKFLVFGVVEALPRDGHQAFGELANVREILTAPLLVNRTLPGNVARLPYRQMELALATLVPTAYGYRQNFDPTLYAEPIPRNRIQGGEGVSDVVASNAHGESHREELERESALRKRQMKLPILPKGLSFVEFGVSQHYIKELRSLSQQYGFKIVFLFLPFYKGLEQPVDLDFLEQFAPVWRPTFIMHNPDYYLDAAHLNEEAAGEVSVWIADRINTEIETQK